MHKLPDLAELVPAHSPEAERGVLGAILLDARVIDELSLVVRPDEFHSPAYREIYEACLELYNSGKTPDPTLLARKLGKRLALIGGMATLLEIAESQPTAANAVWYAEEIRAKHVQRFIAYAAAETLRDSQDRTIDIAELAERFEARAFEIGERRIAVDSKSAYDLMTLVGDELAARKDGKPPGMATGFADLDAMLKNLRPGTLTLLAARPSMGKSALAANIAVNVAERDEPVCFFSLEMSYLEIGERMLSAKSRVPLSTLQSGDTSAEEGRKLISAQSDLSLLQLYVNDSASLSMSEIAAVCRRQKRRKGLSLVIIDYLQLIRPENPREPRQEQVAGIGRRLKGLSRELQVPILALAQLNRATEQTAGNRPKLSNLRESGALEQDADNVLFVHREEYYAANENARKAVQNQAQIIVAKQRNGQRGVVKMNWFGHVQSFENAAPEDRHAPVQQYDFD